VAEALDDLRRNDRHVAAVINELGETIGIVTIDDIMESVFHGPSSRSERMLRTASLTKIDDRTWQATGMTTLRRLSTRLGCELPESKSITVAGVLQEGLQRLPALGDVVRWGNLRFTVIAAPERGLLKARIELVDPQEPAP
jgi:CBS domain containing-hemolysin-like protein